MVTIIEERLPWLETFQLERGAHSPDGKACVMEAVAYIAGESWSDHPECASTVISAFLRNWNDSLSDEDRQMLKPLIPKLVGTRTTKADEKKRAWLATDWLVRECAPAFLRCAGLTEHAEALEKLAALTTAKRAEKAQPAITAAWGATVGATGDAARAAARAAAGDAARAAARAAAGDAARDAAGDAARDAARDAAGDVAWAAAWAAAEEVLEPTVKTLQESALLLLDRMIKVGRVETKPR